MYHIVEPGGLVETSVVQWSYGSRLGLKLTFDPELHREYGWSHILTYIHKKTTEQFGRLCIFSFFLLLLLYKIFIFHVFGHLTLSKKKKKMFCLFHCTWKYLQCVIFNSVLLLLLLFLVGSAWREAKRPLFDIYGKRFVFLLMQKCSRSRWDVMKGEWMAPSPLYNEMYTT